MATADVRPHCEVSALGGLLSLKCHAYLQEYCNGGTVKDSIAAGRFSAASMPHRWAPLIAVLGSIADGMQYMHARHICHGDLNPSNVLLKVRRPARVGMPAGCWGLPLTGQR